MDNERFLLNNLSILDKNPLKNAEAIESNIVQLCEINPSLAFEYWLGIINNNIEAINKSIKKHEFVYDSIGYKLVDQIEGTLVAESFSKMH